MTSSNGKVLYSRMRCIMAAMALTAALSTQAHAGAYADAVLADEPIGYWNLDQIGGEGTVAPNLGTLGGDADGEFFGEDIAGADGPSADQFPGLGGGDNKAIFLDFGIDVSGVSVFEPILDDRRAFTLEGWINPSEHELSNRAGLFGQDNAIEFGFIGASDIHFWAELPDGGDVHINSLYEFDNEEWHHIALTADGETGDVFFYVDGEEQELQQNNSQPLDDLGKDSYGVSGNPFNIGGGPIFGSDAQYFGFIDEVSVFDKYLTQAQIEAHYKAAVEGETDPCAPLNDGSLTDPQERLDYVHNVLGTWMGDSNKDGEFSSADLVAVFAAGEYEDAVVGNSTWATGDWNGDGDFTSGDLVTAFTDGGYEQGPLPMPAVVPEPSSIVMVLSALLIGLASARRRGGQ